MSSTAPSPKLLSASVDAETDAVVVYGDGVPMLQVTRNSALWLISQIAEALTSKRTIEPPRVPRFPG